MRAGRHARARAGAGRRARAHAARAVTYAVPVVTARRDGERSVGPSHDRHAPTRKGREGMTVVLAQLVVVASWCAAVSNAGGTVYVFRHCVRSIDMSVLEPFTARSFPSW